MLIRPANPADIVAIRALERQSESAAHWSEREYDALFSPDAPKRIALVASDENVSELNAFLIARCGDDGWEIENVVVAPGHRRHGIGSALVRRLLNIAGEEGAGSVLLEVRESNLAARQLYDSVGFVKAGRRRHYYRDPPEDALLLRFSAKKL